MGEIKTGGIACPTLFAAGSGRREVAGQPPRSHADLVSHAKLKINDTNRKTDYHPPDFPQPGNNRRRRPRDYRGWCGEIKNSKCRMQNGRGKPRKRLRLTWCLPSDGWDGSVEQGDDIAHVRFHPLVLWGYRFHWVNSRFRQPIKLRCKRGGHDDGVIRPTSRIAPSRWRHSLVGLESKAGNYLRP